MSSATDIATAGLLHDIGKFWSRTGYSRPYSQDEAGLYGYSHVHSLWSAHFCEMHGCAPMLSDWVRRHHKPDSHEAFILSLADWLASSERDVDESLDAAWPQESSLVNLLAEAGDSAPGGSWFPLSEHGRPDAPGFFPSAVDTPSPGAYRALWDRFEKTAKPVAGPETPHATWLALLRRFCSRIPAATPTRVGKYKPDISLYDHCRATAAIAACLWASGMLEDKARSLRTIIANRQPDLRLEEPICLMVCGNLSGIQDFLYSIATKQAARSLRGRSFALQLAAEACATWLCEMAGLPVSCILYNGGGRFYLLLPAPFDLAPLRATLNQHLFDAFDGRLTLQLGTAPVSVSDFINSRISAKWAEASRAAGDAKLSRYSELAHRSYGQVFGMMQAGGHVTACSVCGKEAKDAPEDATEQGRVCADCESYAEIGRLLPKARWLIRSAPQGAPTGINRLCHPLGFEYNLVADPSEMPESLQPHECVQLDGYAPGDTIASLRIPTYLTALTYRISAKAWPHTEEGGILTFEELAANSQGIHRLGVFRADGDNLGALFATGLGENASLGRVAALSALLTDFFEGYLPALASSEAYQDAVGVIYAGGDDLFVVGAWDKVIDYAIELRAAFTRFCGRNPALSFSGGVVLVEDHLPIRYAADMAADAEEQAKQHERHGRTKDTLTLFDTPIGFEELDRFEDFHLLLMRMLAPEDGEALPMAFLRRLFDVWEAYLRERKRLQEAKAPGATLEDIRRAAQWQRWRWLLVYSLERFTRKHKNAEKDIKTILERLLDGGPTAMEDRLGAPLRWTELKLRKEN